MKSKPLLVIFLVCFGLFLFLGIKASQAVFDEDPRAGLDLQTTKPPILVSQETRTPQPLDPFTLIILVDDLESINPRLEGVWLQRFADGGLGSMFFPLLPSQAEDGVQRDMNLRGAFWLEGPGEPSQQFQTILHDRNLFWNWIIILDYHALRELGQIMTELDPTYLPLNQVGLAGLSYSVENRAHVQSNQVIFIDDLCSRLPYPAQNELLQRFLEGFGGHLQVTGSTPLDISLSWKDATYCLFPTLNLTPR